jgi:hypothetical protein
MTQTRLSTVDPALVADIGEASPALQRRLATELARWVAARSGLADPRLHSAVEALQGDQFDDVAAARAELESLEADLDEVAFDLQDRVDAGEVPYGDYAAAFARARVPSTLLAAIDPDPHLAALESAYEAQSATGDLDAVHAVVDRVIGTRGNSG